jgi:phosphatidylglycerol:prolipoprotein diacylglycerol transferase
MGRFLAEAYLHKLDPFLIEFPASWSRAPLVPDGIRWYGLSYALGFVIAWGLLRWMARTHRSLLPVQAVGDFMFAIILGVLVGGRLGYAIFYQGGAPLVTFYNYFPFWDLLAIHRGGMASHGGMIGIIIACSIFAVRRKLSILHLIDLCTFIAPPGLFLGRIANFLNAELWGRPMPAAQQAAPPWWSIKYPTQLEQLPLDQAEALTPAVAIVEGGTAEWNIALAERGFDPHAAALVITPMTEDVIEAARAGNEGVAGIISPMLTAYYPSQLIQAIAEGPILMGIMALAWLKPRKPGIIGSVFLIVYGALRIATEVVRQPDEGVALLAGLSRGQVLSLLMFLAGIICLFIAMRRNVEPVGGLLRPR